jgi:hypothetical protein
VSTKQVTISEADLVILIRIAHAAYWDEHTAGLLPGAGYNHKAQHIAGCEFGWQNAAKFTEFERRIHIALEAP